MSRTTVAAMSGSSSPTGTSSGGSLARRSSPSARRVSLASARRLSFRRALARPRSISRAWPRSTAPSRRAEHLLLAEPGVPDLQVAELGEPAHRLAVRRDARGRRRSAVPAAEPAVAAGDRDARREALEVPLPRAGQRLVEVVEVEHQAAVRGRVAAEVGEVRVAAELRRQARARRGGEVGGHDRRRAAEERERRRRHAPVADRDELGQPLGGLALEDADGVGAPRRRRPVALTAPRRVLPRAPATGPALRGRLVRGHGLRPSSSRGRRASRPAGAIA